MGGGEGGGGGVMGGGPPVATTEHNHVINPKVNFTKAKGRDCTHSLHTKVKITVFLPTAHCE